MLTLIYLYINITLALSGNIYYLILISNVWSLILTYD